jgi:alkanesulfonate monooxygenase SsuD/methylene tetrahydromethanopterin reductase-like flavin-dependent oxidoreductase (luciferase family)
MKFAYFTHVWNKPGLTPSKRFAELWRELRRCEDVGFDYAFAVEHHFMPHESWMPSPTAFCAGAVGHTDRLRLGPMGYITPLYDPLRLAEEIAVLDNMLDGRLEVGLTPGIAPQFFRPFGVDFDRRKELALESLQVLKAAFTTEGPFSFDGKAYHYEDVALSLLPMQKPHPPFWMPSRDSATLDLLAAEGVHTGSLFMVPRSVSGPLYRQFVESWRSAGHAHDPNVSYWTLVYVDETDELAMERAAPHVIHSFCEVMGFGDTGGIPLSELAKLYEAKGEYTSADIARNAGNVEFLADRNLVFIGSPDTVAAKLREAAEEGSFNTLTGEFNIGRMAEEELDQSVRLFATEVIPQLRDYSPF